MNAPGGPSTATHTTSSLLGFQAPRAAGLAVPAQVPAAVAVDVSAGFLDRVADADLAAPTAANLRKLIPGPTHLHTVEARETPRYLAHLDRVLAALDFGSKYAGYSVDQATAIDDLAARFGNPEALGHPDVIAVAEKYRLPPLALTGRGPIEPGYDDPAHPDHGKLMAFAARNGWKLNSSFTRLASLHGAAESILVRREHEALYYGHHTGRQVYARALWYLDMPRGLCPGDKRKRERHAAAAERLMNGLTGYVEARSGMTVNQLIACPWARSQLGTQQEATAKLWKELMSATSYLTLAISGGQVPEGTETEMLVAEVVTRSQQAIAERLPAELPAPRPAEDAQVEGGPVGAVGSAVITDAEAEADERERARESVLGSIRKKLAAKPDADDRELRQVGMSKFRKLVDMGQLIKEAREQ